MKQREGEDAVPRLWNANYTKVFVANFMIFFSFMLLTPLLPIYLSETFGADKHTIGTVLFGYSVLALIARMFSGYIVDSFSRKRVLLVCFFFFSLFFVGYIAAGSLLLFAIVRTLHGAPFGATTVANSTMAIDVLPSERRTEGIGYYGLANNIASAISPSVAIWIFHATHDFNILFWLAMLIALGGMLIVATVKVPAKPVVKDKPPISLDRFFLVKGTGEALTMACFSFSYGVVSTYVAIYGREQLGVEGGAGTFFLLLSLGLILSRLQGSRALRQGRLVHNAAVGVSVSLMGYMLFAALHNEFGYYAAALVIGLGNGHMYPAYQNMFVNLAPHSQRGTASSSILVAWDVGLGIGVLLGGLLSEKWGYSIAFWAAWLVNLVGFLGFWLYVKAHFNRNKLR
ncbi:MAG: MFS transporter [Bacteroidales bacterium]|nr:MFS transporter [Bacteroidales bacterium]